MRDALILLTAMLFFAACAGSGGPADPSSTTTTSSPTTTTAASVTTGAAAPAVEPCSPPSFLPGVLPERVMDERADPAAVPLDEYTLQPGTIVTGWTDQEGNPVLAIVRGALPPTRWITTPEKVDVRGVEGALGELRDGVWAVAWFEGPDRCDEYYLVFYPPTGPEQAKLVAESLTGGG